MLSNNQDESGGYRRGGRALSDSHQEAAYVDPAVVDVPAQAAILHLETFALILYAVNDKILDQAIGLQSELPQGSEFVL